MNLQQQREEARRRRLVNRSLIQHRKQYFDDIRRNLVIGNLTVLEPYRPIFIGAALVALFFAWRRIYRPAQACKLGEVCAIPQVRATYKLIFWVVAALVLVALGFPYVMPFFY